MKGRGVKWTPLFGQKNGWNKVEPPPCGLSVSGSIVVKDPLSWADRKAYSTPVGEAEAGNAGEQPVKE